jgi:hypothetical protein
MNKESPTADASVPQPGTEQALSKALDQATEKQKPEEFVWRRPFAMI